MPNVMTRVCRQSNNRLRNVYHFLLIVFLCGLVASCAANPVTGKDELMLVSEEEEIRIGNSVYRDALWSAEGGGGEYPDAQLKRYLEDELFVSVMIRKIDLSEEMIALSLHEEGIV